MNQVAQLISTIPTTIVLVERSFSYLKKYYCINQTQENIYLLNLESICIVCNCTCKSNYFKIFISTDKSVLNFFFYKWGFLPLSFKLKSQKLGNNATPNTSRTAGAENIIVCYFIPDIINLERLWFISFVHYIKYFLII